MTKAEGVIKIAFYWWPLQQTFVFEPFEVGKVA